jgi:hypothetical protein
MTPEPLMGGVRRKTEPGLNPGASVALNCRLGYQNSHCHVAYLPGRFWLPISLQVWLSVSDGVLPGVALPTHTQFKIAGGGDGQRSFSR